MLKWVLKKIVGSQNQREIKKILPVVERINELEVALQKEDESVLKEKTAGWMAHLARYHEDIELFNRRKLEARETEMKRELLGRWTERFATLADEFSSLRGFPTDPGSVSDDDLDDRILEAQELFADAKEGFPEKRKEYLEEILPEVFAVVKNAARRLCGETWDVCDHPVTWEMVHFDVQLIGGIALHRGMIAEMATGEGKTLVATLPTFLNALTGLGVHLVTVNDYLARRDSEWMGYLFKYLGLSIGCIQNGQQGQGRREQYEKDITYGTASEFGFDYLRDNGMAQRKTEQVQRGHYYALIDEVDSILIDEARTPLIISGPVVARREQQYDTYKPKIDQLARKQTKLCNQLAADARKLLDDGNTVEAGDAFFKVKLGQPRNRALMRAMEDPEVRRLIDKTELEYYKDPQKTALFELKEELFFTLDEKQHEAELTEQGREFLDPNNPEGFVLPDIASAFSEIDGDASLSDEQKAARKQELQSLMNEQAEKMHTISQLLRAYCLYERDVHYVVEDNRVMIVDENTGRKMPGRRWSDGLHQAVEAKEGVTIEGENQTYATITIQNYFRLYEKLGGMTGTAETEAAEFHDIYKLEVLAIPTNRPVQRIDHNDKIFKTRREKYKAVIDLIKETHAKGQPILLGTASVESSETLARMLKRDKIPHNVLNAKFHMQEAEIVSRAGLKGAVTVATNMAGRGTDIKLGEGVADIGGLFVIGTERHQSRRIDRQLRGRCSRQGDPGMSVFYVSFEDELMMKFGASERMTKMMDRFGLEEGQELEHPWLNKSVENAQKRVEERNYLSRKHVLEYDDVMNNQRTVIYGYRNEVLDTEDPHALILDVIEDSVPAKVSEFLDVESGEPDIGALLHWVNTTFPVGLTSEQAQFDTRDTEGNIEFLVERIKAAYELKSAHENPDILEDLERYIILNSVDRLWQEHLYEMDGLRESIGNYRYAQKDPLVEYKHAAYELFLGLMDRIKGEVLNALFRTTTRPEAYSSFLKSLPQRLSRPDVLGDMGAGMGGGGGADPEEEGPQIKLPTGPIKREQPKVGRNDPCPCGSGKKYKQCCGKTG
ncbi:MAG: preprotein translocase subunit SecA [Verrucomicrobiae bacterium]|nr:preprotein translocase subunit SecA [Verrucomicrobiae bacterium]